MNKLIKVLMPVMIASIVMPVSSSADAVKRTIQGRVVTGTNRFLGQPLTDFGGALGTAGFTNVGAFNPQGDQPDELTPDTPVGSLLATYVDPDFLALVGKSQADIGTGTLNVSLKKVPVNVDPAGQTRVSLAPITQSLPTQPSIADPVPDITLARWARAEGVAVFKCSNANTATVSLTLKKFLPNRLYSVWAVLGGNGLSALPLGGVPNVFVTDHVGNAKYRRVLNFCPFQSHVGNPELVVIDIVLHSDQQLYGAVPDLPFSNLFTGIVNQTQYEFEIKGTTLSIARNKLDSVRESQVLVGFQDD